MSKGLDLIKRQQPEIIDGFPTGNIYIGVTKEELTELEKELKEYEETKKELKQVMNDYQDLGNSCYKKLKALELIKTNRNLCKFIIFELEESHTTEEINLLKEVLL